MCLASILKPCVGNIKCLLISAMVSVDLVYYIAINIRSVYYGQKYFLWTSKSTHYTDSCYLNLLKNSHVEVFPLCLCIYGISCRIWLCNRNSLLIEQNIILKLCVCVCVFLLDWDL